MREELQLRPGISPGFKSTYSIPFVGNCKVTCLLRCAGTSGAILSFTEDQEHKFAMTAAKDVDHRNERKPSVESVLFAITCQTEDILNGKLKMEEKSFLLNSPVKQELERLSKRAELDLEPHGREQLLVDLESFRDRLQLRVAEVKFNARDNKEETMPPPALALIAMFALLLILIATVKIFLRR
jgi:hypothetical protein